MLSVFSSLVAVKDWVWQTPRRGLPHSTAPQRDSRCRTILPGDWSSLWKSRVRCRSLSTYRSRSCTDLHFLVDPIPTTKLRIQICRNQPMSATTNFTVVFIHLVTFLHRSLR